MLDEMLDDEIAKLTEVCIRVAKDELEQGCGDPSGGGARDTLPPLRANFRGPSCECCGEWRAKMDALKFQIRPAICKSTPFSKA